MVNKWFDTNIYSWFCQCASFLDVWFCLFVYLFVCVFVCLFVSGVEEALFSFSFIFEVSGIFCIKRKLSFFSLLILQLQLEMLLIPNALCWSSRKCNCACALPAEVQLRLRVTCRNWQKLFAGKNFLKILVAAQTQLRSYSEQQRAFGNSNICNYVPFWRNEWKLDCWC